MRARHGRLARCGKPGCGALIFFALTEASKRQPLNAEPDPAGNVAAYPDGGGVWRSRAITGNGHVYSYERVYMPHQATCTPVPVERIPAATVGNVVPFRRPARNKNKNR